VEHKACATLTQYQAIFQKRYRMCKACKIPSAKCFCCSVDHRHHHQYILCMTYSVAILLISALGVHLQPLYLLLMPLKASSHTTYFSPGHALAASVPTAYASQSSIIHYLFQPWACTCSLCTYCLCLSKLHHTLLISALGVHLQPLYLLLMPLKAPSYTTCPMYSSLWKIHAYSNILYFSMHSTHSIHWRE